MPETGLAPDVIDNVALRTSRIVRMPFEGQDAFWAYAAALPRKRRDADRSGRRSASAHPCAQSAIKERMGSVEVLTAAFLLGLAVMNAVLVFVFSRTVTRPLEALSKAAERLADGDFDSRVDIVSKGEFGSMGALFNRVGRQLKEHFRVREALQAAVEIQQSLLAQKRRPGHTRPRHVRHVAF
ncbi:MAG: HAMP domain-containing protein [Desulfobacterales bacterium]|nr:HAMP domain-containing protein [Desulfobacterales bacterium]